MSDSPYVWVQVTETKRRLVRRDSLEAPQAHPAKSPVFGSFDISVKRGVGHIARSLPNHKLEDGSPAVKGADGYTPEGFPIVEGQATIDRIKRLNPEFDHGERVMDDVCNDSGI